MQTRTHTLQDKKQFDLNAVSGSGDDSEPQHSDHGCDANSTAQGGDNCNWVNDPNATPSLKTTTAKDIRHFFDKSEDKVVCKICRQVFLCSQLRFSELTTDNMALREAKEVNPSMWSLDIHYEYLQKTLTTSLHPHIEKHHLKLYLNLAKEHKWKFCCQDSSHRLDHR